jgi:hypothetical protein
MRYNTTRFISHVAATDAAGNPIDLIVEMEMVRTKFPTPLIQGSLTQTLDADRYAFWNAAPDD